MFALRTCTLESGEQLPLLIERASGLPHEEAVLYLLSDLRPTAKTCGTMKLVLRSLANGLEFLAERRIDLVQRIASGAFLDRHELAAFADRCRKRVDREGLVVGEVGRTRYFDVISFIEWKAEPIFARASRADQRFLERRLEKFLTRAKTNAPRATSPAAPAPGERLGLLTEQRELLLRVIEPGSPENPFRADCQKRNQVHILLAYELGARAGEELALYRSDIGITSEPVTVTIHRRHDDPNDPRKEKPVVKTNGRQLQVSAQLGALLRAWAADLSERAVYPLARKHPFLIVTHKGAPLTLSAARKIFERLGTMHPELAGIGQHVIRHDWNDRWIEAGDDRGEDAQERAVDQKYAQGWSSKSKMPERYARRAIHNRTNRRLAEMQEKSLLIADSRPLARGENDK